jgi:zinc transporter ZupT
VISLHKNSESQSKALVIATFYSGIVHLFLAVLGTFVLKRFPTSFSVGFFLGILVILANQNLILFGVFRQYTQGSRGTNLAFSNLSFFLFVVLTFFSLLLVHFRHDVVVAAIDTNAESAKVETGKNQVRL